MLQTNTKMCIIVNPNKNKICCYNMTKNSINLQKGYIFLQGVVYRYVQGFKVEGFLWNVLNQMALC